MITVLAYPLASDQPAMFRRRCATQAAAEAAADFFLSIGHCRVVIKSLRRRSSSSPASPFYRGVK